MNRPLTAALTVAVLLAGAGPSHATLPLQKKAKEAGFPATNCQYCHVEKLPVKGKVTHNERGAFLVKIRDEKKAKEDKKANEIDVAWLKEFVETKK
jgi:hypothetical protein